MSVTQFISQALTPDAIHGISAEIEQVDVAGNLESRISWVAVVSLVPGTIIGVFRCALATSLGCVKSVNLTPEGQLELVALVVSILCPLQQQRVK